LEDASDSATVGSVLEIFHSILKDFRRRLSVINEDAKHNLVQHAGCQLLNILNEHFDTEKIMNTDNESKNLIIVPTLTVILDIKKLEADEIENVLDFHLMQVFQSLSGKINSKIESICGLLCYGYLPAVRKVLDILHYTMKFSNNIDVVRISLKWRCI